MSLVVFPALYVLALTAPSFDSFVSYADGTWRGASYSWAPRETALEGPIPLGVSPGYVTKATASKTVVSPVMRSCGGAIQGVQEVRTAANSISGTVVLNRQADGTSFFTYGSWAQAPPSLSASDAEEADMLCV